MTSKRIGQECETCHQPLTRRPQSFHWRGTFYDGAYCETCNSLWAIEGEELPPLRPQLSKMDICTDQVPTGEWTAIDRNTYDGAEDAGKAKSMGWGKTEQEAIADLIEKLEE